METKPENVLIYATSNRRHLIKENWSDRDDMETGAGIHRSDTIEEKLSLVNRFGVTICYSKPTQQEYFHIVERTGRESGSGHSSQGASGGGQQVGTEPRRHFRKDGPAVYYLSAGTGLKPRLGLLCKIRFFTLLREVLSLSWITERRVPTLRNSRGTAVK